MWDLFFCFKSLAIINCLLVGPVCGARIQISIWHHSTWLYKARVFPDNSFPHWFTGWIWCECCSKGGQQIYTAISAICWPRERSPAVLSDIRQNCSTCWCEPCHCSGTLFKSHYVYNVEYSLTLQQFWDFFAAVFYRVIKLSDAKPVVRTLSTALKTITL